jgi:8-oxo-dGTP diphosphatase
MDREQVFSNSSPEAAASRAIGYCPRCGSELAPAPSGGRRRQACGRCGYMHYLNPSPGITIIVRDGGGKALVCKRVYDIEYGGLWCLPGGYIEYEESFLDTAHREVREETGLLVEIEGIVNAVSNLLDEGHHTLVVVMVGRAIGGAQRAGDDVSELRWIDAAEHRSVPYAFEADRSILDRFFAGGIETIPADPRGRLKRDDAR